MPSFHKTCSKCFKPQPVSEFRKLSASSHRRVSECRSCRRKRESENRQRARSKKFTVTSRDIRKAQTVEQASNLIASLARQVGGWEPLARLWAKLAFDEDTSEAMRLRALQTAIHFFQLEQQEQLNAVANVDQLDAEATILQLHAHGRLAPTLQRLFAEGRLTYDHIDPPPSA